MYGHCTGRHQQGPWIPASPFTCRVISMQTTNKHVSSLLLLAMHVCSLSCNMACCYTCGQPAPAGTWSCSMRLAGLLLCLLAATCLDGSQSDVTCKSQRMHQGCEQWSAAAVWLFEQGTGISVRTSIHDTLEVWGHVVHHAARTEPRPPSTASTCTAQSARAVMSRPGCGSNAGIRTA